MNFVLLQIWWGKKLKVVEILIGQQALAVDRQLRSQDDCQ